MLARLLRTSEWRRVSACGRRRLCSREESVRLSALLSGGLGGHVQRSGEIVGLSLRPERPREQRLQSDFVRAALGEHAALDLSAATYAGLPEPPGEAVNEQDRPYDSAVCLGPAEERAAKHVSEERLRGGGPGLGREASYEEGLARFGLGAEEQRAGAMEQVQRFWSEREHDEASIFLDVASRVDLDVASVLAIFRALNIDDKEGRVARFKEGRLPLLALVEQIDAAVRVIVDQWRAARTKTS